MSYLKKIITLSLLFSVLFSVLKAQTNDNSFINTNGITYFNGDRLWTEAFSIDHIIESDTGTLYYPKTTYGNKMSDWESYPRGTCDVNTSFFGDSIFINNAGDATFYTHRNKVFIFMDMANVEVVPWIMYEEDNGGYISARYTGFLYEDVLGEEDVTLKKIELSVYDSLGFESEDHPCHNMVLKTTATLGFVNIFNFNSMKGIYIHEDDPIVIDSYILDGAEINGEIIGVDFLKKTPFKRILGSVEPGTIVHYTNTISNTDYEIKREYLSREMGEEKFYYSYRECKKYRLSGGNDTIVSEIHTASYDFEREYKEFLFDSISNKFLGFWSYGIYMGFDYRNTVGFTYWHTTGVNGSGINITNRVRVGITPGYLYGMGGSSSNRFIEGLGHYESRDSEGSHQSDRIVYYKYSWQEWGTALDFDCSAANGVNELSKNSISFYPNPASDFINVEFKATEHYRDLSIRVLNVLGEQVYESTIANGQTQLTLDVNPWQNGLYILQIKQNNKIISSSRFVKI